MRARWPRLGRDPAGVPTGIASITVHATPVWPVSQSQAKSASLWRLRRCHDVGTKWLGHGPISADHIADRRRHRFAGPCPPVVFGQPQKENEDHPKLIPRQHRQSTCPMPRRHLGVLPNVCCGESHPVDRDLAYFAWPCLGLGTVSLLVVIAQGLAYGAYTKLLGSPLSRSDRPFTVAVLMVVTMWAVVAAAMGLDGCHRAFRWEFGAYVYVCGFLLVSTAVGGIALALSYWLLNRFAGWPSPPLGQTFAVAAMVVPVTVGLPLLAVAATAFGSPFLSVYWGILPCAVALVLWSFFLVIVQEVVLHTTRRRAVALTMPFSLLAAVMMLAIFLPIMLFQ